MMMKYHQLYFTSDQISNCRFHPNPAGGDKASKKTALPGLGSRAEYPQEDGCSPSFLFVVCGVVVFFVRLSIRTSASTRFVICAVAFVVLTDFQEKEKSLDLCVKLSQSVHLTIKVLPKLLLLSGTFIWALNSCFPFTFPSQVPSFLLLPLAHSVLCLPLWEILWAFSETQQ